MSLQVTKSIAKLLFYHFRVINSKLKNKVTNSMVKLFYFGVKKKNLKNIKLHFELLTKYRLILEIQFYICPVPREFHQGKPSLFF